MLSFEAFLRFENWLRALYRLIGLNLLWLATTVLGGVVIGFGPASAALARYLDRWVRHGETPPLLPTWIASLRNRPLRAIAVGDILLLVGAVIVTNIFLVPNWYLQFVNVVALGVLGVVAAYVFPLLVASDLETLRRLFAGALLLGVGSLHWTILGAAGSALTLWLLWLAAPLAAGLFGVAVPALTVALITRITFRDLDAEGAPALPAPHRRTRAAIHQQPTMKGLAR